MSAVAEHLRGRGIAFEEIPHAKVYTSIAEAQALGIAADEVLKGIVVKTAAGYALAAIPGARRLDMGLVRHAVEDHHARLATEEELEREFPAYELGALPPVGSIDREAHARLQPLGQRLAPVRLVDGVTDGSVHVP